MSASDSTRVYLAHYQQPPFWIDTVTLHVALFETHAQVAAQLTLRRNLNVTAQPLVLMGDGLTLLSLTLDGQPLLPDRYTATPEELVIQTPPDAFSCEIVTRIEPQNNTALMGLYRSGNHFLTQCEAEGFRRIVYYLDRPDVLARFTTTLEADRARYPILLSNGNPVDSGETDVGRHWVKWVDPFPKPAYLFALVAGDFVSLDDRWVTASGLPVQLQLWVEPGKLDQCAHAMEALKAAMQWDENRWGLEYDLDRYMIVAVDEFNMGAMENKGLNIFNAKYVLAKPDTATDQDYEQIIGVIGHEYFHNWSGNRVTCRDWFQLALKEGLTVFRDQEFLMDQGRRAVHRVLQAQALRTLQFIEDSGPMAHPVRPTSYLQINNFYTVTIYEKGAEIIRMLHTLLGETRFKAALRLYFSRHDGQAATIDDFLHTFEEASGVSLQQFQRWYGQAGTPTVNVDDQFDTASGRYTLRLTQSCATVIGQPTPLPFPIPLKLGLLDQTGQALPLQLDGETAPNTTERLLLLQETEQQYVFVGLIEKPTPSLLRSFSAPIKLHYAYSPEQCALLLRCETDTFARWDAAQTLAAQLVLHLARSQQIEPLELPDYFIEAVAVVLNEPQLDAAFVALVLTLPMDAWLAEQMEEIDPDAIYAAKTAVRRTLSRLFYAEWLTHYKRLTQTSYTWNTTAMSARALRNLSLTYLTADANEHALQLAQKQFDHADNMTDQLAALQALDQTANPLRTQALKRFETQWQHEPLVIDKWFALQAKSPLLTTVSAMEELIQHPTFSSTIPNRVYAVVYSFAAHHPTAFHMPSGDGYRWVTDQILKLDPINPQVAARIATAFSQWRRYNATRKQQMRESLERMAATKPLSDDLAEIVEQMLKTPKA